MTKLEQILSDFNKLHWKYTYGKKFKQILDEYIKFKKNLKSNVNLELKINSLKDYIRYNDEMSSKIIKSKKYTLYPSMYGKNAEKIIRDLVSPYCLVVTKNKYNVSDFLTDTLPSENKKSKLTCKKSNIKYSIGKHLVSGAYGDVFKLNTNIDGKVTYRVVKYIKVDNKDSKINDIIREFKNSIKAGKHKLVPFVFDCWFVLSSEEDKLYGVMISDFMNVGDLGDLINKNPR